MRAIVDVEANGLDPDKIWVISTKDIDTQEVRTFDKVWLDPRPFLEWAVDCSYWVGHYFLGYDIRVLRNILDLDIDPQAVLDTLVVSRLIDFNQSGGHGLERWGEYFGVQKPPIEQWDVYDPKMVHRCEQDVEINYKLFKLYEKYINSEKWALALKIEHSAQDYCRRLEETGFPFDIKKAEALYAEREQEKQELEAGFQRDFPPRFRPLRTITPVLTKAGRLHSKDFRWYDGDPNEEFSVGASFSLVEPVAFDPASKQQCVDRLWNAGWKPTQKTDGYKAYLRTPKYQRDPVRLARFERYGWKLDELNLATLPATAPASAKKLARWLELAGKQNQIGEWIRRYNPKTGRVHGRFAAIGGWTHRCAHSAPNMANASSDHEARELWIADNDWVLVGVDAESIQLRVLAHYMEDDRFTFAVVSGDKKDGTDPHSLNAKALGDICLRDRPGRPADKGPRDDAKTFIYAFLLGCTATRVAEIFECSAKEAATALDNFISAYPGLKRLREVRIAMDAKRGYFEGLDGRFVRQNQERLMLAGYLQNGESIVMKLARMIWEHELRRLEIPYQIVNWVHDEWQTMTKAPFVEQVKMIQCDAIRKAGEILKLKCPMAGKGVDGKNWAETH